MDMIVKHQTVEPNLSNFIQSFRDIGYSFEVAVADIIDNSIAAKADEVKILLTSEGDNLSFCMLDNGLGMSNDTLVEAMRLSSKNPKDQRDKDDLGRFGLGLKTASFSQCKKLTVISKYNGDICLKRWDLDYLSQENKWLLITPDALEYKDNPLFKKLECLSSGTLIIWESIDKINIKAIPDKIIDLREHIALTFHRFLEGVDVDRKISVEVNNFTVAPLNPFNVKNYATSKKTTETLRYMGNVVQVTPYILPHHSKTSKSEWDQFSLNKGYIASQGFYLYRNNRLLVHGVWWGLHRISDAHKLVRIKIDIDNNQDKLWNIDIKKSTAYPNKNIKEDLKRIAHSICIEGSKPFTGRGRKVLDKSTVKLWSMEAKEGKHYFSVNKEHPLYVDLVSSLDDVLLEKFNNYTKSIESYLPLDSIQSYLQQRPHDVCQNQLNQDEIEKIKESLAAFKGMDEKFKELILKSEMFN